MTNNEVKESLIEELQLVTEKTSLSMREASRVLGVSTDWIRDIMKASGYNFKHKELISLETFAEALVNSRNYNHKKSIKEETLHLYSLFDSKKILITLTDIQKTLNISYERTKRLLNKVAFFSRGDDSCNSQKCFYYYKEIEKLIQIS